MSNKTLLEIDESIIRKNLLLTEKKKEDEEFNELLQNLDKAKPASALFRPLPGACIKCHTENGGKVFLNICHTTELPAPEDLSDEELLQILNKEDEELFQMLRDKDDKSTWSIPMSIGHERYELDKGGSKCLTYDIAINTKYYEKCQQKKAFWIFTVLTIISAVAEKHERAIKTEDYIVLKNRKVMGKLHDHRVQVREPKKPIVHKPLIEEIASTSKASSGSMMHGKINIDKKQSEPQYVILRKPHEGDAKELIGYFKLPRSHRIKDMRVDVGEDRIIVEAPRTNFLVDVFVPYILDQDKVTAVMDQNVNVLRLNIPVTCGYQDC